MFLFGYFPRPRFDIPPPLGLSISKLTWADGYLIRQFFGDSVKLSNRAWSKPIVNCASSSPDPVASASSTSAANIVAIIVLVVVVPPSSSVTLIATPEELSVSKL